MADSLKLLRIKEAAELLGVNPATLRKWDKEGKLPAIRQTQVGTPQINVSSKIDVNVNQPSQ